MAQIIYGKNVVKECINDNIMIHEVIMCPGKCDDELLKLIKAQNIPIKVMDKRAMDSYVQSSHHQGLAAKIEDYATYSVDEIVNAIPSGKAPLIVLIDGLEDPNNLGAILRSCDAMQVDGVIIGKHRSVGLTPTVAKVSTGAINHVKVAIVTNLVQSVNSLKKQGYWIIGSDANNAKDYREGPYDMPVVLVVGSEGFGISKLLQKQCDFCVSLPMLGHVNSLNASVACSILLYQIHQHRFPIK